MTYLKAALTLKMPAPAQPCGSAVGHTMKIREDPSSAFAFLSLLRVSLMGFECVALNCGLSLKGDDVFPNRAGRNVGNSSRDMLKVK